MTLWLVAFCLLTAVIAGDPRPASTAEEREKAVRIAHALEEDPLNPDVQAERPWLITWLEEVPDISVDVCLELIDPLLKSETPLAAGLSTQLMLSSAAFVIEHPDQAADKRATSLAGLKGVIRAYERASAVDPKARMKFLDGLLEKRDHNELDAFVTKGLAKCAQR